MLDRLPFLGMIAGGCFLVLGTVFFVGSWLFANLEMSRHSITEDSIEDTGPVKYTKSDLPSLLSNLNLQTSPITGDYVFSNEGAGFVATTSLDTALQNYAIQLLNRSMTHEAAVIALRPDNGQILAMAHSAKNEGLEEEDLCLRADLPAASLFKIVSAAAVIEAHNFSPNRPLYYRGGKYTLYKSQLKQEKGRYTNKTSFKEAFSGSINPVFGKIGIYDLGKDLIAQYADKFLFNHVIPFDLPVAMSRIDVPEDDFGLAEIASGFNKRTLLSPLHAVMITSAVANNGTIMEPWLVKDIRDKSGQILYSAVPSPLASPIKSETAGQLRILMGDTVINGTCRKTFRSLRRKKAFKGIELGAKTGTINDPLDRYKYDWLTAYALSEKGDQGICLVVLSVHGDKLGIRAKNIARDILNFRYSS